MHHRRGHRHSAVFPDTNAVAVETHSHTPVGVSGVYEVPGKVEVGGDYRCKSIVGPLVGGVGTPINKGAELLLGYGIIEQGGIVALYH